jgi:hypothetical protein
MAQSKEQMAQRDLNFVVVDEVDSILIDEARTPLIISAPDMESTKLYQQFAKIVPQLKEGEDFNLDEDGIYGIPIFDYNDQSLDYMLYVSFKDKKAQILSSIAFMGGVVGLSFREFAMTVIIAITCSTLLALTLTPMMCSKMLKPAGGIETFIEKTVNNLIGSLINKYKILLTYTLKPGLLILLIPVITFSLSFPYFK